MAENSTVMVIMEGVKKAFVQQWTCHGWCWQWYLNNVKHNEYHRIDVSHERKMGTVSTLILASERIEIPGTYEERRPGELNTLNAY